MTTITIGLDTDQELLTDLMGKLGYVPVAEGGLQLRGFRNPAGGLRWVWPATLRQPLFLEFYNAASPKAKLFSAFVRSAYAVGIADALFPLLPYRFASTQAQPWPTPDFALFTGTPGPYRKAVCCYADAAGQQVFAKLPLTLKAAHKVQAETKVLQALSRRPSTSFQVPEVVKAGPDFLLQTSVKSTHAVRASAPIYQHFAYLQEQLRETMVHRNLADTDFWQTVLQQVTALQALPETRIPYGLRAKLQHLLRQINPQQVVPLAFAHGDFTPWNCWVEPEKLALYDLEFALPEAPLLYDLFHFHVQQGLLVRRATGTDIRQQLWDQAWEQFPAFTESQLQLALRLYLLHQISSFALVYHEQEQWHTQIQWLLAGWNELLTLELASHLEHRQLCLYDLLDGLAPQGGVVLKPRAENAYYPSPTSDVDLLLTKERGTEVAAFLQRFPVVRSAAVRRQAHMVSVDCFFQDGSFLSVDVLHQLLRKAVRIGNRAEVLAHAQTATAAVPVPAPHHDFEYTWLFYWLNQSHVPTTHLRHFQQRPAPEQQQLLTYFGNKYGLHFDSLTSAAHYEPSLGKQLRQQVARQPGNQAVSRWWRTCQYGLSTIASFFRPQGFVITFSGVDGAGKSTVIAHVKERLEKKWRKRVVVIRHRPSVLPILSAWKYGRQEAEKRSAHTLPRQGNNQKVSSSLARFSYYYLDYVLGQAVVWLKYTRRGHVVLYDRYYFDFINDSRRSNICLPERFTKALYTFVNKPRLNFFLYAAPEEILRRKQELSADTIVQLTQKYQALFGQLSGRYHQSQYVPIENHNLDATLTLIGRYIQQEIK